MSTYSPIEPFECVHMDYITKLPRFNNGKTTILTMVELLSEWTTAKEMVATTATEAFKGFMEEVV